MEWMKLSEKPLDPNIDMGWYVILVKANLHIAYFSQRNWNGPWHIPDEWIDPSHYIKLDSIEGIWCNYNSDITMD